MSRIKDIVELEKQRPDMAVCRIIHLYAEGMFCHAYEVSTWLCHKYTSQLRATHRYVKGMN